MEKVARKTWKRKLGVT